MKKIILMVSMLLFTLLNVQCISANSSNLYVNHQLNKSYDDHNGVQYKIQSYRYLKDPLPDEKKHARFLIVDCVIDTRNMDTDNYERISKYDLEAYSGNCEADSINDCFSDSKLKQMSQFKDINFIGKDGIKLEPGKEYHLSWGFVVYPYEQVELEARFVGDKNTPIVVHQVKTKNQITMDSEDELFNYLKENSDA